MAYVKGGTAYIKDEARAAFRDFAKKVIAGTEQK